MILFPSGTQFATFSEIKEAVRAAREAALVEARENCGRGTFVSRGASFSGLSAKGDVVLGEAESAPWSGTGKSLLDEIHAARFDLKRTGVSELYLQGGFNFAENPRALADGSYDPWVAEWSVCIWKRGA
jgi:hypothetical protein